MLMISESVDVPQKRGGDEFFAVFFGVLNRINKMQQVLKWGATNVGSFCDGTKVGCG